MINLPVATLQPYPSKFPWYDVSQYLTPGLSPFRDESVLACADGNFVHYSFMLSIDRANPDLDVNWLTRSMHPSLRVVANTATVGWFSVSGQDFSHRVEVASSGWMAMTRWPSQGLKLADFTLASLTLSAPRRKP